jgi:hypothetical protein
MSAIGGNLMARAEFERRHPRVGIDQLRRELRHADEELFTVLGAVRGQAKTTRTRRGPIVFAFLATVPLAYGLWASFTGTGARDAAVQVAVAPVEAMTIAMPADAAPAPQIADPPKTRAKRTAVSRPGRVALRQTPRPTGARATRAAERHTLERHVPRPLSPGEFGRAAFLHGR